jgi:alpha-L-rhamnosidase
VLDCLDTLAWFEREIGDGAAAAEWTACAADIRAAARRLFVDEDGLVVANGSQGAIAVALDAGLLSAVEVPAAVAALADAIRSSGIGITTGFALTRTLVDVLARHGESQLIFDLLSKASQPGIGAMLVDGPGTFWENWWIDPANTGTGSLDHVGLGAPFAAWAWRHLAGVRPTGCGWRSLVVEPSFVTGVDTLTLTEDTPRGPLELTWRRESGTVTVAVQVPRGSEATLILDAAGGEVVGPGRHVRVVERVDAAPAAPVSTVAWTAPAIARVSADVDGPSDLLETAEVIAGESTTLELLDRLVCMPVPHAQTGRPVVRARATDASASPTVVLRLREPLDLGAVHFVYALIDQCLDGAGAATHPCLTLVLEDGSARTATAKTWPAGYNRVAVDTRDLPAGSRIAAIRIGLRILDAPADTSLGLHSADALAAFHLGEVGASSRRRTW